MDYSWTPGDMKALEALLCPSQSETKKESTYNPQHNQATPASIGASSTTSTSRTENNLIDDDLEAGEKAGYLKPKYAFIYKQAVTPNDVYLQMSNKNPSTVACEDLVMRVNLPDVERVDDMKLDVKPTHMKLSASMYFLAMHLPHKVDAGRSSAKWDAATYMLEITMPILERDLLL